MSPAAFFDPDGPGFLMRWWKGSFLAKEGLPADQIVHHYHPVHFLGWLDARREADTSGDLHASVFEKNHEGT